MPEEKNNKKPEQKNTENIKKTAEAYETVSEEFAKEKAENSEEVSKEMIESEKPKQDTENKEVEKSETEEKEKPKENQGRGRKPRKTREEESQEALQKWEPKTKLGKEVKENKIKNIDEILEKRRKILEPEIVDTLMQLKSDLISVGQSKGKFGGGKRRAWRQTQKKTKEGNVPTFSAYAVVGDEDGHVGLGEGKSQETLPARDKATRKAKLNLIKIKRGCSAFDCSCSEPHTIPFKITGKCGSLRLTLIPAPQGTGLVAGGDLKKILKLAGIKDLYTKTEGKTKTTFNLIKACINALEKTNPQNIELKESTRGKK
ncbi:MAG: 30S ribosomal protein S5 [Nanoarchaeota archaeon]